ncbi:MAG TPA: amidohydrolase [Xanthomonadaceae bacterium]|nr:amidohydrolase [Xanthomonadaceae bacterium]
MKDLRISMVQAATVWHDAEANRTLYGNLVRPLAGATDLVVLPETFTSGFSNDAAELAEGTDGPSLAWLRALAADTGAVVTGSVVIRDGAGVYNRLIWMRPDGSHLHYDKRHLFRMAREHERYAPGCDRVLVELAGWQVCPVVCYDLRFPVFLRNRFDAAAGRFDYDLMVCVANWPAPRAYAWRTLLRARAIENLACVVGVNRVGLDGNQIPYDGDSVVLDALGQPLIELGREPQVVTATLPAAPLIAHRQRFPAQLDADSFDLRP